MVRDPELREIGSCERMLENAGRRGLKLVIVLEFFSTLCCYACCFLGIAEHMLFSKMKLLTIHWLNFTSKTPSAKHTKVYRPLRDFGLVSWFVIS